jgi:TPR repeat protein
MKEMMITVGCLILLICSGCAHTPGDAALRGGQPEAAADLYAKGAELGDATAALKLGLLISEGRVSDTQYGSALKWYMRSCELGSLPGCHNVGVAYQEGKYGVSKDPQKACEYYRKSAMRGYMQAQYNLASVYSSQEVQPPDDVEGYKWMLLSQDAARKCSNLPLCDWILKDPPGHKAKLKGRLTEDQIKEAERLAASWTATK